MADDPEADFCIPSEPVDIDSKDLMAQIFNKLGRLYAAAVQVDKARDCYSKSVAARGTLRAGPRARPSD